MTAPPAGAPAPHQGFRTFLLVWLGSTVSALGSALAGFVIGVWAFQQTGSATLYSLIAVAGLVPALVVAPFAGALADRWDRRWMMIWATVAAMVVTGATALLMLAGRLEVWHLYVTALVGSVVGASVRPAGMAVNTSLIPPEHFARAAGLMQFGGAGIRIVAPAIAGILLARIHAAGVLLIDVASFLAVLVVFLAIRIPQPHRAGPPRPRRSILVDIGEGWRYVRDRPGIFGLLLYFSAIGAAPTIGMVLLTPLVLRTADVVVLGTVMSIAATGALAGGLLMSTWGGPKRRFHGIMLAGVLLGISMIVAGWRSSPWVVAAGAFGIMMGGPIMTASFNAFWQVRTPLELHGRVFSIITMVAESSMPVALLVAGPATDFLLEPLMAPGGALGEVLGPYLGTGPGRGIGLLYVGLGVFVLLVTA
ncbi:MAG TPA: MFS transporter, partial [Longimicrobiaceae bacterium]|nr:MFS transporter [Longimicrobiaceae bacterium]